jgi:hypothetical protein
LAVAACVPTFLAIFARWSWFCELFTHFRVYYAAVLLTAGALLLFFRGRRWVAAGAIVVGLWNVLFIAPLYVPAGTPSVASGDATGKSARPSLRILVANVYTANRRFDLVTH